MLCTRLMKTQSYRNIELFKCETTHRWSGTNKIQSKSVENSWSSKLSVLNTGDKSNWMGNGPEL